MEVARELASLGVEITDHAIRYRHREHPLASIASVGYTATKTQHSVNLIPTGTSFDAQCRLFLVSGEVLSVNSHAHQIFGGDGKQIFAPVWLLSEIVCELTFEQRIRRFEECLAQRNFVEFGDYQIHRDGTVFRRARRVGSISGNAANVRLGPFHLTVPGSTGPVDIPIDVDRDCVLYILKRHHRLAWNSERIRERRHDQRRRLYEGIVALGAKMSKADGVVTADEIQAFKDFFRTDEFPIDNVGTVFNAAVNDGRSISECARMLAQEVNDDALLDQILIGLIAVAAADDVLQTSERDALHQVGLAFGFTREDVDHLVLLYAADVSGGHAQKRGSKAERSAEATKHLQVLGLTPGANAAEVKDAYRRLAAAFHPDLLRSKGVPAELVRVAEETLAKLNASYEWLRKNSYGAV
jgi:DnaJ like chaperone protein